MITYPALVGRVPLEDPLLGVSPLLSLDDPRWPVGGRIPCLKADLKH